MSERKQHHEYLSIDRLKAFATLFGCQPTKVFSPDVLYKKPDEDFPIDVLVYEYETDTGMIEVAVTNGMSDQRMMAPENPQIWARRELIQYFPQCTREHAVQLHRMAWVPVFDGFMVDTRHSVGRLYSTDPTPWDNAFFWMPPIESHRDFEFDVEGDKASLLWHIPISDGERAYKTAHGPDALLARMQAVSLPWIFDETNRPPLVE